MTPPLYPLCVDLDDTLIAADIFLCGIARLVLEKPWHISTLIITLSQGRPQAKAWLETLLPVQPENLPYRAALLDYLKNEKAKGRKIFLVSASNEHAVKKIAAYLGLFDGAFGSSQSHNLKGYNKALFIQDYIGKSFAYAGDSLADLKVWQHATSAILCGKAMLFKDKLGIPIEAMFE